MNYIYIQGGDTNAAMYPVDSIRGMKQTGDLQITIFFTPVKPNEVLKTKIVDSTQVNFVAGTGSEVKKRFQELVAFVNQPASAREDGFILLGNDETGESFTQRDKFSDIGDIVFGEG